MNNIGEYIFRAYIGFQFLFLVVFIVLHNKQLRVVQFIQTMTYKQKDCVFVENILGCLYSQTTMYTGK